MRLLILFILLPFVLIGQESVDSLSSYDQKNAEWQRQNIVHHYPFWGSAEGFFLGIDNRYELGTYAVGLECKAWAAFHGSPIWNASYSFGYRYLVDFNQVQNSMNNAVHVGFQFSFIGLETDLYFGKYDQVLWSLTPKIGIETGHLSIFYGYGIPLINKSEKSWKNFHIIKLSYSVNLVK